MSLGNFEHVYIVVCIIFAGPESHVIRGKAQVVNDLLSFAVLLAVSQELAQLYVTSTVQYIVGVCHMVFVIIDK